MFVLQDRHLQVIEDTLGSLGRDINSVIMELAEKAKKYDEVMRERVESGQSAAAASGDGGDKGE